MRKSIIFIGVFALFALILIKSPSAEIFSSISGKVVDAKTSKPLSGVYVVAETYDSGGEAISDKNGLFIIRNLKPGNYKLTFVKPKSQYIQPQSPQIDVVLPRGKNLVNVTYQMVSGGSVTGHVRGVIDSVLKNSSIGYEVTNPKQSWGGAEGIAKIANDGSFIIQGLPEGDGVTVRASVPGYVSVEKTVKVLPNETVTVDFDIQSNNLTGIRGQVTGSDGTPQKDLRIIVRRENSRDAIAQAVTDATGVFSIVGLQAGRYDVTVFYDGKFIKKTVLVISGSSAELIFIIDKVRVSNLTKIFGWLCTLVVSDAYAATETMPVANKTVNVAIAGPNACTDTQIAAIDYTYSKINWIIAEQDNCKIGPRMRDRLKLRLDGQDLVAFCPLNASACIDGFGNKGCAQTVGYAGGVAIRFCSAAFENKCGCFEAVGFHELVHTVQWSRSEKLPYTCEKIVFPCGNIPDGITLGNSCEVDASYYNIF